MSAPNSFLLVATDVDSARLSVPSALDVANYCFEVGRWGVGYHTSNRRAMKPGDKLLIYLAGRRDNRQSFVGTAVVAGECEERPIEIGGRFWPLTLPLRSIRRFRKPVPIRPLLPRLSFIKDPTSKKWGSLFQLAVIRIRLQDIELVAMTTNT